jgi:hypothetical protein
VPVHPSASQQQVSDTLRGMGLSVKDEFRCPKSGYSIDMRLHDMQVNAKRAAQGLRQGGQCSSTGSLVFWRAGCQFGGTSMNLHRCHPALLGMELADGERRKEGVSKGQPAHFMILNDSRKVATPSRESLNAQRGQSNLLRGIVA